MRVPQNGWLMREHPIKMDDVRVPPCMETLIKIHVVFETYKCESRSSKGMPDLWLNWMVKNQNDSIQWSATFISATLGMVLQLYFLGDSKHAVIWKR